MQHAGQTYGGTGNRKRVKAHVAWEAGEIPVGTPLGVNPVGLSETNKKNKEVL